MLDTRPTIRDVARHAGVSIGTASNVFANRASVHPDLRERVASAAVLLGYQHNDVAASLRRRTSRTIGISIPDLAVPFFVDLLQALESAAEADGYDVIFVDSHEDGAREAQHLRKLIGRRVDGLFVVPTANFAQSGTLLAASDQPIIVVDRVDDADKRFASVAIDNHAAAGKAFAFLAERGHREIMLVVNSDRLWNSRARIEGFKAAASRHGLQDSCTVLTVGMTLAETEQAVDESFAQRLPSAILAASGIAILGALQAVQRRKLAVPRDIALLAFDDVPWMNVLRPSISTVRQPIAAIAAQAWAMMSAQLEERDRPARHVRLPVEIIERESTAITVPATQELARVD
jgi:LacI family transcriptional regulator